MSRPFSPIPVRLNPDAETDVREIVSHISKEQPAAAQRFVVQITLVRDRLSRLPRMGRLLPDRASEMRQYSVPRFRNFLVVYQVRPRDVMILRIFHGARDRRMILDALRIAGDR